MSLRTKQALILLLATVLPFGMGGAAVAFVVAPAYRRAVSRAYEEESRRLAEHIAWNLARDINRLEKLAAWTEVRNLARRSVVSDAAAARMDRLWPKLNLGSDELQPILNNTVARELRWWRDTEANAAEILATDGKGRVIAATGKAAEYVVSDDGWWQQTYAAGKGRVFVSDIVPEAGGRMQAIDIAVPIYADGRVGSPVIGVLKMVLDVPETFRDLAQARVEGGHTFVVDQKGRVVLSLTREPPVGSVLPERVLRVLEKQPDGTASVRDLDEPQLYAWSQIPLGPHGEATDVPGRGLWIVTRRPTADAFGPLRRVQIWMLFIGLATIAIAVGLGYWLVDVLVVRQIRLLAAGMRQLARGDFSRAAAIADELTHVEGHNGRSADRENRETAGSGSR